MVGAVGVQFGAHMRRHPENRGTEKGVVEGVLGDLGEEAHLGGPDNSRAHR